MYKELVTSIMIVIVIFLLEFLSQKYTNITTEKITTQLLNLKSAINSAEKDNMEINEKVNDIRKEWLRYNPILACYIEHNELEKIETNFIACKSFIEMQKYDLALSELDKTIFVLEHISDIQEFNLENIF